MYTTLLLTRGQPKIAVLREGHEQRLGQVIETLKAADEHPTNALGVNLKRVVMDYHHSHSVATVSGVLWSMRFALSIVSAQITMFSRYYHMFLLPSTVTQRLMLLLYSARDRSILSVYYSDCCCRRTNERVRPRGFI